MACSESLRFCCQFYLSAAFNTSANWTENATEETFDHKETKKKERENVGVCTCARICVSAAAFFNNITALWFSTLIQHLEK